MRRSTYCSPREAHIVSADAPVIHDKHLFLGKFGAVGTMLLQRMQLLLCEESETPRMPSIHSHVTH